MEAIKKKKLILWLTGLPCSGKTTLASESQKILDSLGHKTHHLDGDTFRAAHKKPLGFSQKDRDENIRLVIQAARDLQNQDFTVIASFVSPFRKHRKLAKESLENYLEIFVDAPLAVCRQRDTKGHYAKALAGEIKNFTGISDVYERPENPDIHLRTDEMTVEECVEEILEELTNRQLLQD